MVIEQILEKDQPRKIVYCLSTDIQDNGDGTYSFVSLSASDLGLGSMVYVVDQPYTILSFDGEYLYSWSEGGDVPPASGKEF